MMYTELNHILLSVKDYWYQKSLHPSTFSEHTCSLLCSHQIQFLAMVCHG